MLANMHDTLNVVAVVSVGMVAGRRCVVQVNTDLPAQLPIAWQVLVRCSKAIAMPLALVSLSKPSTLTQKKAKMR